MLLTATANLADVPDWIEQGPGPINNGQTEGIPGNPVVGSVQALAPDPGDANILFAGGSNGGVWRTTNALAGTPMWTPLTDSFPSLSIGGMGMNPADPNELIAAIGNRASGGFDALPTAGGDLVGALYTTDALAATPTWTVLSNTISGSNNQAVAARNGYLLVAGTGGVYRSTDGGATFNLLSGADILPTGAVLDLFGDPGDADRFYVAGKFGVFRCDDLSAANPTWTDVTDATMSIGATTNNIRIGIHDDGVTNVVYVGAVNSGQLAAVTWSTNQGGSWMPMDVPSIFIGGNIVGIQPDEGEDEGEDPGSQGRIHFSLVADPNDANLVYVGGDAQSGTGPDNDMFPNPIGAQTYSGNLFRGDRSVAQGSNANPVLVSAQWTPVTDSFTAGGSAPHADSRRMVFDAAGNLLESDDGGVYRRTSPANAGGDWSSVNGNLRVTEFWTVSFDTVNNVVFGGAQDTGTEEQSATNSFTYDEITKGDGFFSAVDNTSVANQSVRYTMGNTFKSFRRRVFDNTNSQVGATATVQLAAAATPGTAQSGLNATDQMASAKLNVFVLNATDPRLMMVGATGLYEDNNPAGNAGDIIADVTPATMTGFVRESLTADAVLERITPRSPGSARKTANCSSGARPATSSSGPRAAPDRFPTSCSIRTIGRPRTSCKATTFS